MISISEALPDDGQKVLFSFIIKTPKPDEIELGFIKGYFKNGKFCRVVDQDPDGNPILETVGDVLRWQAVEDGIT